MTPALTEGREHADLDLSRELIRALDEDKQIKASSANLDPR